MTQRHITISGDLGSGKSTVASHLATLMGWRIIATGEIQRSIAREMNVSTLQANHIAAEDRSIDDRIDGVTLSLAESANERLIFDSRMAWHFLPNALRVRLLVDPGIAASRIMGRAPSDVESYSDETEALAKVAERSRAEVARFQQTYGVDITELGNFDLVVDTSDLAPRRVAEIIAASFEHLPERALVVSPRRVIPVERSELDGGTSGFLYWRPFVLSAARATKVVEEWLNASLSHKALPLADVVTIADKPAIDVLVSEAWQREFGVRHDIYVGWQSPA